MGEMTVEEMDAELLRLELACDEHRVAIVALRRERDARVLRDQARERVAAMSDAERAALMQEIRVAGIAGSP